MLKIKLREMLQSDLGNYTQLRKEVWLGDDLLTDDIIHKMWEGMFDGKRANYCIETDGDNDFCGYCAVRDTDADKPEIEIELLRRYRGQGIGFQALSTMMSNIEKSADVSGFIAAVEPDNYVSQCLMYKLGGKPGGIRQSSWLSDEDVDEFEKEHMNLLDNTLRQVAADFCIAPKKLLSSELLFEIPVTTARNAPNQHGAFRKCFDCDRALGKAIRKYSRRSAQREVLLLLLKYEHDPERARHEIISYLESKLKMQI